MGNKQKKKKAGEIEGMLDDKQSSTVKNVPLVPIVVIYVCAKNY